MQVKATQVKTKNKKWDEDLLLKERKDVLARWPTGKEVVLSEAIDYGKSLSESRSFLKAVQKLHREGKTGIFPRGGTPILEDQIELNKTLIASGVSLIPVTPDTFCRTGQFEKAQQGLEASIKSHKAMLNGYPVVIHGVKQTRKMTEANEGAYCLRLTNIGGVRLMAEIGLASGITASLADPFMSFANHEKKATVEDCVICYQYIYRLIGYYAEKGVILTVDLDGQYACGPFPLDINLASIIAAAIVAAEQGVKSITARTLTSGNLAQDVAWARVLRKLLREYLDRLGYRDVLTPGLFVDSYPLYPYPQETGLAFGYVGYMALVAAIAEAEATAPRTIDEGVGIPSREAHAMTHQAARWIVDVVRRQKIAYDTADTRIEETMAEAGVRAIVDRLLEMGDGDIVVGYAKGAESGVMDTPFCPNIHLKDKVLGARDSKGALRYVESGNIPVPEAVREFHRQKVSEREQSEHRKLDYRVAIEDLWSLSKGKLVGS